MSLRKLAIATLVAIAALKTTALPVAGTIEGGHKDVTEFTDFLVPDSITTTTVAARDTTSSTVQQPAPGVSGIDIVVVVLTVCGVIAAVFVLVFSNCCGTCFCDTCCVKKRMDTCCVKKRIRREAKEARKEIERVREAERRMAQLYGDGFMDIELGPVPGQPTRSLGPMPEQPMRPHLPRYTTTDPIPTRSLGPTPEQPICSHPPRYTTIDPGRLWAGPS